MNEFYSNSSKTVLPEHVLKFINKYSYYFVDCQEDGLLKDEVSIYLDTDRYNAITGWQIEKFVQSHYYHLSKFEQWEFKTSDGYYGNLRHCNGFLTLSYTEREYEYIFPLGREVLERLGIFYPACKKCVTGFTFEELCKILNWTISPDASENWA